MRKANLVIVATTLLMATFSCTTNFDQVSINFPRQELTFEASFGDELDTKTVVQSDGKSIWWSAHESINVFFGASESSKFTSMNDEPVQKARFKGTIEALTGETETGVADTYWAVYPYNEDNTCDGTSITAVLPSTQVAKAETFADGQWMTVANSYGLALSFYAVGAGFRFSMTKEGVTSVTFKGNNNEVIAGKAKIGMDANSRPIVKEHLTEEKEITLAAPGGGVFEVGKLYYLAIYPTNFTKGFTITFNTATETGARVYDSAIDFKRTDVHRGKNFDSEVTYISKQQPNNEIWYTTNNGKIFNVSGWEGLISNTYSNGKGIIRFANNLTEIPADMFVYNYGLNSSTLISSLSIPASVQIIKRGAFRDQLISELVIPQGCLCEEGAFGLMAGLQKIIGDNVTEDGRLLVENNTIILYAGAGISSYVIPSGVTKIGEGSFSGQLSLSIITMPNSITELGSSAFSCCNNLTEIHFSDRIKIISSSCFYNYPEKSITSIVLPSQLTSIEDYGFSSLKVQSITIPSGVTYIGNEVYFTDHYDSSMGVMTVRVLASTPPTLKTEHAFGKYSLFDEMGYPYDQGTTIKVPAASVDLYKADPKWSKYYIVADESQQ